MSDFPDGTLEAVLQGNLAAVPSPPSRALKLMVASTHCDFEVERRHLHDNVWPELQRELSTCGVDVEILDVQQGREVDATSDPPAFGRNLEELERCHNESLGCFLLCLVGCKYGPRPLPRCLESAEFLLLSEKAGPDKTLLSRWYTLDENAPQPEYLLTHQRKREESESVLSALQSGARAAHREGLMTEDRLRSFFLSGVHHQLDRALKLSSGAHQRIVCAVRQLEGVSYSDPAATQYLDLQSREDSTARVQELVDDIIFSVNRKNVHYFNVPWRKGGPDGEYLKKFGDAIYGNVKALVEEALLATTPDWQNLPDRIRKPIQEVVRESQSHLTNIRHFLTLDSEEGSSPLLRIRDLMLMGSEECVRHSPVVVCGPDGAGKSTLLAQVLTRCPEWLGDVVRVVRCVGRSPCTSSTPELLRNLCLHLSLTFGCEIAPSHYSFELSKLSTWFQDLLKAAGDADLVLLLDDLHLLRCAPNNQASILGWLPWNLPPNVHIVCSVAEDEDGVLALLKTRIATAENFVCLPPADALGVLRSRLGRNLSPPQRRAVEARLDPSTTPLHAVLLASLAGRWTSGESVCESDVPDGVESAVELFLSRLEVRFGLETMRKVCSYLTCTSFGLREAELVDLLASEAEFCPGDWIEMKEGLGALTRVYYVDKRPYLHWSHSRISRAVRSRYLPDAGDSRLCHSDLASAFHLGFLMQKGSSLDESKSRRREDWSDMLREIDELWFHLMKSGDSNKLKQDAVCNFDFLLAATRGASISYTRSILEIVRCQMLDWETELLYNMTKQSVDVLSRDPQQLATEILNWLRPFLGADHSSLEHLVSQAREWCDSDSSPLLVPQNGWLSLPLPPQVTAMTCPHPLTHMVTTPDNQHALCVTLQTNIEMYHLPSKSLFRTFRGHRARITCLHLTPSGRWLLSGSKDAEIIVWSMDTGAIARRFSQDSSGVQCLTTVHSETLVISGSESGVVVVSRPDSGQVVHKLENHRGVVSSVAVNSGDDVFASASTDRCVCIWSLEDFSLLNTLHLGSPVTHLDISPDSTFLLVACTDQSVRVRSLTTGSEVHGLYGHSSPVTAVRFARDNCRAAVGCKDGKIHVFDVHSAKLLQTLAGHSDPVASIQAESSDRFLVSAGGNRIVVWNFWRRPNERHRSTRGADQGHREPVTCLAVSRDGALALSGSRDATVRVWQLSSGEVHAILRGHSSAVTCVAFSPNGLFAVSGSEDTTLKVWGLTLGLVVATFQEHESRVTAVSVTQDSRRVLSVDSLGHHRLWAADTGAQLVACRKPSHSVALHANVVFAVAGKNHSSLKFWPVSDMEAEKSVSHSDVITCYTVTYDCQTIVTGSNDMSLKVWEVGTGKLTQVLVGHEGAVTCAACAPLSPSLAVSGASDCNLIVWDLTTGNDNFKLRGHTEPLTCVRLTLDGSLAISASDDNTLGIWSTSSGVRVGMLGIHQTIVNVSGALNLSQMALQLANQNVLPLLRLHNNPTKGMVLDLPPGTPVTEEAKTPGHSWRGVVPQRVLLRGNLKREQSFDSFYWDLRSKRDLGTSLEDFRRVPSPFGSREHLHLAGTVWDGRQPKVAKLPKHKILKKQQSMFACFPEFVSTQQQQQLVSPQQQLVSPQALAKELDKRSSFGRSRAASLEETAADGRLEGAHVAAAVRQSSVCTLS